ncbi:MAG: SGNH/GDSL hydrolase family protein [Clostridia bacterium]|nr:SGNH/GDSL hydrolase family protein [Clostridia bacterium]
MQAPVLAIYGDSISLDSYPQGGWPCRVEAVLKPAKIYNHAIGASGLSGTTPNNTVTFLDQPQWQHPDAEIALIWHGTNDWYWGAPLGEVGQADESTYAGAIESTVHKLRTVNPQVKLVWMTPIFRCQPPHGIETYSKEEAWVTKNQVGATMREYVDILFAQSRRLCFPVIDLRVLTGFSAENKHLYYRDIAHPSAQGFDRIADLIVRHLRLWYL